MTRKIDVVRDANRLNNWVKRSMGLFQSTPYLDRIHEVYPFELSARNALDPSLRRGIIQAHNNRDTERLIEILKDSDKFPYEDPIWYILKTAKDCLRMNPLQVERIAKALYSMTAEETLTRLESPPALNTQTGPMFRAWLMKKFKPVTLAKFNVSKNGIVILDVSEAEGKKYIESLGQKVSKRPDLIAKANTQIVIGEAKWIGCPGGNQTKQVEEVLAFCQQQRDSVRRIGIVDGFPWALYKENGNIINSKEARYIQESEYNIMSALLLDDYLQQFGN